MIRRTHAAVAAGAGYLLGRYHKKRLGMILVAVAPTADVGGIGGKLRRRVTYLPDRTGVLSEVSPEAGEIIDTIRGDLRMPGAPHWACSSAASIRWTVGCGTGPGHGLTLARKAAEPEASLAAAWASGPQATKQRRLSRLNRPGRPGRRKPGKISKPATGLGSPGTSPGRQPPRAAADASHLPSRASWTDPRLARGGVRPGLPPKCPAQLSCWAGFPLDCGRSPARPAMTCWMRPTHR